jgi:hypothetical protein
MKQDIEYAALVMGFDDAEWDAVTETIITVHLPGMRCFWRPLEDDGDSRRLEIACMQGMHSNDSNVPVHVWETDCQLDYARRAGNAQEYREAVFALAVAIGKTMEGNDNAG